MYGRPFDRTIGEVVGSMLCIMFKTVNFNAAGQEMPGRVGIVKTTQVRGPESFVPSVASVYFHPYFIVAIAAGCFGDDATAGIGLVLVSFFSRACESNSIAESAL